MGEKMTDISSIPATLRRLAEAQPAIQKDWADLIGMADALDAHLSQPAQAVDVDEAMVERMAKWMCRHEIPSLAPLDEVLWRMGHWRRYLDEARSALTAALPKDSNGAEGVGS